ncbi:MAG: DUF58 domain-containing protein [Gemmatimonadota bacterium]
MTSSLHEKRAALTLLSPAELLRLGSLDFVARLVVEGFLAGRHRSPGRGGSLEFAEHRPYVPGDDLRRIDWKVYGRSDRYYVRESEEETNLRAMIVLDASASMAWAAEGRVTKFEYARLVGAALGHLLLIQQDAVGLAAFAGGLVSFQPPRGGPDQRVRLMEALTALEPAGETRPDEPFRQLAERLPRRGVLILISDLLGPPDRFLPGLWYFRHRKHEVVVLHVLDPAERSLAGLEDAGGVVDAETDRVLQTPPAELAEGYRAALLDLEAVYRAQAHDRGFDYVPLSTDEPVGLALGRYLERRRAHPGRARAARP